MRFFWIIGLLFWVTKLFAASEIQKYEFSHFAMNTFFQATLYSDLPADRVNIIVEDAWAIIDSIEAKYSATKKRSAVSLLNTLGFFPLQKEDGELLRLLQKAIFYSQMTGGLYDITVQPLMKIWGFYTENPDIPSSKILSNALKSVSYTNILIRQNQITLKNRAKIDLGSIAKGFAVDRVVEFFKSQSIKAGLINAGGNLKVFGEKADKSPWKIGIRHPREAGEIFRVFSIPKGFSIATSGDYEQFFLKNSVRYHHIINPHSGFPIQNGVCSVSVITELAEDADVLSTVLFILGAQKGLQYANENKLPVFYILETNNTLTYTNSEYWID